MSFLGMGTMEILIILLVAFIFLGPERMIDAARTLGKWTGELRRMGSTVQAEMEDLTNIGEPLSSRRAPGSGGRADTAEPPLDQDHPADGAGEGQGPVAFRKGAVESVGASSPSSSASPSGPSSDEGHADGKEESR